MKPSDIYVNHKWESFVPDIYTRSPSDAVIEAFSPAKLYPPLRMFSSRESLPFYSRLPEKFILDNEELGAFAEWCSLLYYYVFAGESDGTDLLKPYLNKFSADQTRALLFPRREEEGVPKFILPNPLVATAWEIWYNPLIYWKFALTAEVLVWAANKTDKQHETTDYAGAVGVKIQQYGAYCLEIGPVIRTVNHRRRGLKLNLIEDYGALLARIYNEDSRFTNYSLSTKARTRKVQLVFNQYGEKELIGATVKEVGRKRPYFKSKYDPDFDDFVSETKRAQVARKLAEFNRLYGEHYQ